MKYSVHGPYPIARNGKLVDHSAPAKKQFFEGLEQEESGLSTAVGCYVFSVRKVKKANPWYIGLTQTGFHKEVFHPTKIIHYNTGLQAANHGKPELFLIAARTPGDKFRKASKNPMRDIEFLEVFLFGIGLNKNGKMTNTKSTKFFKTAVVPGVLNSPLGAQKKPVTMLKNALGL